MYAIERGESGEGGRPFPHTKPPPQALRSSVFFGLLIASPPHNKGLAESWEESRGQPRTGGRPHMMALEGQGGQSGQTGGRLHKRGGRRHVGNRFGREGGLLSKDDGSIGMTQHQPHLGVWGRRGWFGEEKNNIIPTWYQPHLTLSQGSGHSPSSCITDLIPQLASPTSCITTAQRPLALPTSCIN